MARKSTPPATAPKQVKQPEDSPCDREDSARDVTAFPPTILFDQSPFYLMPNQLGDVTVSATIGTGGTPPVTITCLNLPDGASFPDAKNQGTFAWAPRWDQVKSWTINFMATDSSSPTPLSKTTALPVNVIDMGLSILVDQTMIQAPPTNTQTVHVTAQSFSQNTRLTLTCPSTSLSPHMQFIDNGDNTGTFIFTPGWDELHTFPIQFQATDPHQLTRSANVSVNVVDQPASILVSQAKLTVAPNKQASATLTAQSMSHGATFNWSIPNNTSTPAKFDDPTANPVKFTWTPTVTGTTKFTILATDPALVSGQVTLSVVCQTFGSEGGGDCPDGEPGDDDV